MRTWGGEERWGGSKKHFHLFLVLPSLARVALGPQEQRSWGVMKQTVMEAIWVSLCCTSSSKMDMLSMEQSCQNWCKSSRKFNSQRAQSVQLLTLPAHPPICSSFWFCGYIATFWSETTSCEGCCLWRSTLVIERGMSDEFWSETLRKQEKAWER